MISRRAVSMSIGLCAAVSSVRAALAASEDGPAGPWTLRGSIPRAGGQLHYAKLGADTPGTPPIVLLHKLGGWLSDWRFVAPALAQGRQVIAFDLPGHGGSRWLGPVPYIQSLGETAALLVGALEEMNIPQIDLVGTSLGGCVSVPLAAFWPEWVRRLALVSAALPGPSTLAQIAKNIDAREKNTQFDAQGNPVPTPPALLTKIFGIIHADSIAAEGDASRRQAGHWIQPSERGVFIADVKGILPRIEAPTLLLYGDRDPAYVKFRAGAEAALKHSQTKFVPQSGAFVMQDNPPATAAILNEFLKLSS